jgi:hypothetical protein
MLTLSQYVSPFLLFSSLVPVRDKWPESAFIRQCNGVTNMLAVYLFVIGYSASWGPVPWVLVSEIFPTRLRAYGVGLAGMHPFHILSPRIPLTSLPSRHPMALQLRHHQGYARGHQQHRLEDFLDVCHLLHVHGHLRLGFRARDQAADTRGD